MFAVVKTGGKQYKVAVDDVIKVEKLAGDAGSTVTLDEVLMVGDDKGLKVGTPTVSGVVVSAEILEQGRGDKVIVFKKKRRHNYRRKRGHRQELTTLKITGIGDGTRKAAAKPAPKAATPKAAAENTSEKKVEETKAAPKKAAPQKSAPKKAASTAKKATEKKTAAKKPAANKPAAKKPAAKTSATRKAEEK
ncbi:MAG: 50S ribosomal protein L21 [Alphaproteobacteria bacterium]|nr:MAG: 50S ribosomal protein L21 [Alphaproteobacteria bacterium]